MQLFNGDCLEVMKELPDNSIDLILTDPPYGTTACKWDFVIPYEPMWAELKRIRKENTAIALFGTEPFSSHLRLSNLKEFKYDWIWHKNTYSNFASSKYNPLKDYEFVHIFGKGRVNYYPIKEKRTDSGLKRNNAGYKNNKNTIGSAVTGTKIAFKKDKEYSELKNPTLVKYFNNRNPQDRGQHTTQKPIALLEYLIKTYTLENKTVLDFTMGSGSTGVACVNTNRDFIGIELDREYYETATTRIKETSRN
jgi:site-specific DNA-methyltransferase (adenine-specific)